MSLNAFARDEEIRGTHWQFVGDTRGSRVITLRVGYETEGKWNYMPPVDIDAKDGQTQEDRFTEWVDRFIGLAKKEEHV